ncbi:hypothetical protein BKA62DRAFT_830361 [Auriculariales sp. MPI-PUGE-AT-0066]|nr:hypothetical protein BKA62DRAFT_830361 [Auriculariales sp. MPI-PUGE-AT-0066]
MSKPPTKSATPLPPQTTVVLDTAQGRVLAVADIRGKLSQLNQLAAEHNAHAIIHTGDFGFFEAASLSRISDRTLRHIIMYSPLVGQEERTKLLEQAAGVLRQTLAASTRPSALSEFPLLRTGELRLNFRAGEYDVPNLHVLDEATTRLLDVGGIKLRLLGLGGAFVPHRMFDNGDGQATVAGGQGTMWTTALQIGELVDTSQKVFDPSETRLLVTHASPGREGLLAQLALVVKADLTISAGLHFRYSTSWNEFSVQADLEGYRQKLIAGKESFERIYENVKTQVDAVIDDAQRVLLEKAIMVAERILPSAAPGTAAAEDPAWKNCWNWNLCDAAYGALLLDIKDGRVSAELKSQGFNFAYRRTAATTAAPNVNSTANPAPNSLAPTATTQPPTKSSTPAPAQAPASSTITPAKSPAPPATSTPSNAATAPATNGTGTPSSTTPAPDKDKTDKQQAKKDKRKEKEREKKAKAREDKDKEPGDATSPGPAPKKDEPPHNKKDAPSPSPQKPAVHTGTPPPPSAGTDDTGGGGGSELLSPSDGVRTPTSLRPKRNPWTLFMKIPAAATEPDVREFFVPSARDGITRVNLPSLIPGRPTRVTYVEFGDEPAMRAALAKEGHAEKLLDMVPRVMVADERAGSVGGENLNAATTGSMRGRGRGRGGGFGGGFAQRGLMAAGLARGHSGGGGGGGGGGGSD